MKRKYIGRDDNCLYLPFPAEVFDVIEYDLHNCIMLIPCQSFSIVWLVLCLICMKHMQSSA